MESIYLCYPHWRGVKRMCYNNFSAAFADFNQDYLKLFKYAVFSKIDEECYYLRFCVDSNHHIILRGHLTNAGEIGFEYEVHICFVTTLGYNRWFRIVEGKGVK